jgi:hypothetical protein
MECLRLNLLRINAAKGDHERPTLQYAVVVDVSGATMKNFVCAFSVIRHNPALFLTLTPIHADIFYVESGYADILHSRSVTALSRHVWCGLHGEALMGSLRDVEYCQVRAFPYK